MKYRRFFGASLLLLGILLKPDVASTSWYAGYMPSSDLYGIWAQISTPATAPFAPETPYESGQANWVSTSGPYWIQTG